MAHREGNDGRRRKSRADLDPLAKRHRRDMSIAESKLWNALRDRRMEGVKFRRQHPIGRHIGDLACVELKLVIEVDGESHDATSNEDAVRTKALEALGFQVMRVANEDVLFGFDGVLREIYDVCVRRATTPSPQPSSPSTGGEGVRATTASDYSVRAREGNRP